MKLFLLLCCFMMLSASLAAQQDDALAKYADSLLNDIKAKKGDAKINGLLDLSFFWSDYDTAKALHYIREAEKLMSADRKDDYQNGLLAFYRGAAYFDADSRLAKQYYLEAEKYLSKTNQPLSLRYRVRLWGSYGALLQREGYPDQYAQVLLNKAIPLATQIKDTTLVANNYQNVALVLMNQKQYSKAADYYARAAELLKYKPTAGEERLTVFVNYARNALYDRKNDLARQLLDSAALVAPQVPLSAYLPMYNSVEGTYWQKKGEYKKAILYFDEGLKTATRSGSTYFTNYILYEKFELYKASNDLPAARKVLNQVLNYVSKGKSARDKQTVYYNLAHIEIQMGNHKAATDWYEAYKLATDTLIASDGEAHVLELEKQFHTAEKENELLKLKTHSQQQQLSLERNKTAVVLLTGVALLALVISVMVTKSYQHKKRLSIQKEKLLNEELKSVKQQEQLNLFNAMVQGQEKERNRIARDLHDGLGGMLAGVKLKLSAITTKAEKNSTNNKDMEIYQVINQLDHSVSELRRIARNMMPESLLNMGLEPALRDLCRSINSEQLHVTFEAFNLRTNYKHPFLIAIYRIVQELLTNAVKHADAANIVVQCSEHEEHLYITVEDDGKGFDQHAPITHNGIGLSNVRTRVEILGGTMEIDTAKGRGCTFNIDIKTYE